MKELAYVDSNVFIYPVLYAKDLDPRVKRANEILLSIAKGDLLAYTSTLTWDEVVWIVRRTMGKTEAINQGQKLLGFTNLHFINVDENILSQAQVLINTYNLKPRDAVHAAATINKKLKTIISDDQDFDEVKEFERTPLI